MITFGRRGVSKVQQLLFIFYFLLSLLSKNHGAMGGTSSPPWSMTNIKHVAANITWLHGLANISRSD